MSSILILSFFSLDNHAKDRRKKKKGMCSGFFRSMRAKILPSGDITIRTETEMTRSRISQQSEHSVSISDGRGDDMEKQGKSVGFVENKFEGPSKKYAKNAPLFSIECETAHEDHDEEGHTLADYDSVVTTVEEAVQENATVEDIPTLLKRISTKASSKGSSSVREFEPMEEEVTEISRKDENEAHTKTLTTVEAYISEKSI
jgi:hypothetical protein